ncbi:hypothetical protein AYI68_g391 [Smittium mucronatum]|uniref:Uncharacterized protein n=1 Tax=Smittium mucronatum TaxID=133383 RepID=A0A1R0H8K3_9FUNG|nr:hypothetical protein AYI68_g391 [Smittium mucronatum]
MQYGTEKRGGFHYTSLGRNPTTKIKMLCYMGSDKKIGMSWARFKDEGRGAFEVSKILSKHILDLYFNNQEDFKVRKPYFVFHSISDAQQLMEKYIIYEGKRFIFYQTFRYKKI